MPFNIIEVTGTYVRADGVTPAAGTVTFTLSSYLKDSTDNKIVPKTGIQTSLDSSGSFTVNLIATDDPENFPQGVVYQVTEAIDGDTRTYNIEVPSNSPGATLDLADVAPAEAESEYFNYTLLSTFNDHLNDATDAHDASAISFVPTGTISSTNVQAAIAEVASEGGGGGGAHPGLAEHDTLGLATQAELDGHAAAADPHTVYQRENEKGAANGYAGLDAATKVPTVQLGGAGADNTKFLRGDQTWAAPAGGGGPTALNDLTDVDTTGQANGNGLVFNGSLWVPVDIATQAEFNDHSARHEPGGADALDWQNVFPKYQLATGGPYPQRPAPSAANAGMFIRVMDDRGSILQQSSGSAWEDVAPGRSEAPMNHQDRHQAGGADALTGPLALGGSYVDLAQIATPANPGAGTRRLFVDSADGKIKVRTSAGASVSLEEAGGGGGGYATIQDEGSALTQRTTFNFIGGGVTASDDSANSRTNITIPGGAGSTTTTVIKPSDEPRTNTTTLANDTHLLFAIAANETWILEATLFISSPTAADFSLTVVGPTGSAGRWGIIGLQNAATTAVDTIRLSNDTLGTAQNAGAIPAGVVVRITAVIRNGATAGNVNIQWAQRVLDAGNTIVQQDSYFVARKAA